MEIEPFSLPLCRPLGTAAGEIETRRGFVLRTELDGTPGVGESTPLPGWTESLDECERILSRIDDPRTALESHRLSNTPAARHGLSLAVLDAEARTGGRPLYRQLGGEHEVASVPVNATVGDGTPAQTVDAVEDAVDAGYPAIKVKVGNRRPTADLERIEAIRDNRPAVELRVDANGAWDLETAERIVPELAGLDVSVVEQPLPASDLEGHALLRGRGTEIALDEGLVRHGSDAVLDVGAADVLVCKPMALGGLDVARAAVRSAREAGIDALVTTTIDGAIARAAAVHLAASIPEVRPCGLATGGLLESDLRDGIAPVADGAVAVPQGKGNIPPR